MTEHPMTDATPLASEQITPLNEQHPEAYNLMLGFYCNPAYYNSAPECRPADNVLMAIQYALDQRAALSATPAPSDQDASQAQGEVERRGRALVKQLRAVMHHLNGQAYSSTLSALNHLDAALSGACALCDGSGYIRSLGEENTEIVEDCPDCSAAPAPGATTQDGVERQCPSSPDGRHQVDTSMESGPNNCFHCEAPMGGN